MLIDSLPILSSFLAVLAPLRPAFPRLATFENFTAICFGWIMALGRGRLSDALVAGGLVDKKHWTAFYRFFSRARWSIDDLGLAVAGQILIHFVPKGVVQVIVDDTLHAKGGAHVFGAGMHRDPLSSTRDKARFQFGHCWVVVSISVRLPFARRPRALPVLFRLNVPKKMAKHWDIQHEKKTEQAAELVRRLAAAFPNRKFRLLGDDAYSCKTLLRALPANFSMVGRLPLEAALYGPVPPRDKNTMGRPRTWGSRLPTPKQTAEATPFWCAWLADIYGRSVTVHVWSYTAFWKPAGPNHQLRVVIVRRPNGQYPYEVFFSTEAEMTPNKVVENYAERWAIEVMFHETKDSIGVDHPQPRNKDAVLRTAPTAMLLYSLVVIWYALYGHGSPAAAWKLRPWYAHKDCTSFADMVTTLRRATLHPRLSGELDGERDPAKVHARLMAWFQEAA